MFASTTFSLFRKRKGLWLLLVGLALVGGPSAQAEEKNELSEEASEAIQAISKLWDEGKLPKALEEAKKGRLKFKPESYDYAYMCQMEAVSHLKLEDVAGSLESFQKALELSDKYGYFTRAQNLELNYTVSQIYGQLASEAKDLPTQNKNWAKAHAYAKDWLKKGPTPTQDNVYYVAQAAYSEAATQNKDVYDKALMEETADLSQQALRLAIKPKESALMLLVAALQQLDRLEEVSDYLELLVSLYPNNKNYWGQLANAYIVKSEQESRKADQIKGDTPEKKALEKRKLDGYLHAILTYNRAQKIGLLNTPKDNFYLVGLLINTEQHDAAIDLIESTIRNGQLESTEQNWQLLAQSYQVIKKDMKAIETLKEASKLFPKNSALDVQIANLYYGLDKLPEALTYLRSAVAKGVDKPAPTHVFIAFISMELKKPEDALAAAQEALKIEPNSADAKRLLDTAKQEIEEREQLLKTQSQLRKPRA